MTNRNSRPLLQERPREDYCLLALASRLPLPRAAALAAVLALAAGLVGCARTAPRVRHELAGAGRPDVQEILDSLHDNDAALGSFRATGAFTLESPDLAAVKTFANGSIAFRRPAELSVIGRNRMGVAAFRLTCVGSEFLIEFPATRERPYYQLEGEQFENVPFSVSPSDIVREMFVPEDWSSLRPGRDVRLMSYEPETQTAQLEVGTRRAPRRLVTVKGRPWTVTESTRLDNDGMALAVTTEADYIEVDGVRFPASIDARFPTEQTRMQFKVRKVWPNTPLEDALFDIRARAREAGVAVSAADTGGVAR